MTRNRRENKVPGAFECTTSRDRPNSNTPLTPPVSPVNSRAQPQRATPDVKGGSNDLPTPGQSSPGSPVADIPTISPAIMELSGQIADVRSMLDFLGKSLLAVDKHAASLEKIVPSVRAAEQIALLKKDVEMQKTQQEERIERLKEHLKSEIEQELKERLLVQASKEMQQSVAKILPSLVRQKAASKVRALFEDYQGHQHDAEVIKCEIELMNNEARRYNGLVKYPSKQPLRGLIPSKSSSLAIPSAFPKDIESLVSLNREEAISLTEMYSIHIHSAGQKPSGEIIYSEVMVEDALNTLMNHFGVRYHLHSLPKQGNICARGAPSREPLMTRKL